MESEVKEDGGTRSRLTKLGSAGGVGDEGEGDVDDGQWEHLPAPQSKVKLSFPDFHFGQPLQVQLQLLPYELSRYASDCPFPSLHVFGR